MSSLHCMVSNRMTKVDSKVVMQRGILECCFEPRLFLIRLLNLQVFVALLRATHADSRRGLVKQALDVLTPALSKRLPQGDQRYPIWVRYTKKVLVEENQSLPTPDPHLAAHRGASRPLLFFKVGPPIPPPPCLKDIVCATPFLQVQFGRLVDLLAFPSAVRESFNPCSHCREVRQSLASESSALNCPLGDNAKLASKQHTCLQAG